MQTKFLLVAGVAVILIGSFFVWQLFTGGLPKETKSTTATAEQSTASSTIATPELGVGKGTFSTLLAQNQSLECSVRHIIDPNTQVEGNVFLSQGQLRGDFQTTDEATTSLSSMILNDERTMYVWSEVDGELYGVTVALSDYSTNTDTKISAREPISIDTEVTYNCKAWPRVDNSIFVPPTDVLFRDLKNISEASMEYGTVYQQPQDTQAVQCKLCDQMEVGEARTRCMATFACE